MKQFNYIFLIILSLNVTGYDRITGLEFASRSEVIATNGMAATSHPLATQTAISILKNGEMLLMLLLLQMLYLV